jgi:uncharacterized repeat protein (TIGR02543 family)
MGKYSVKPLGLLTAFAIAIAGVIAPMAVVSSASAAPSLGTNPASGVNVVVSSTTTLNNVLDASNDLQVTGYPASDLVRVVVSVDSGTIQLAATTGLTAIQGYTLDTATHTDLGWQSTQADANTALNGLKYIAGSSAGAANITLTSSYAGPTGGAASPAYYSGNGHYYQYVATARTWDAAESDVANNPLTYTFNGMRGYLATVTSSGENDFVTNRAGSSAVWLGARRDQTNAHATGTNAWYWTDGPEAAGTSAHFFDQGVGAVGGAYLNWNTGEPNGTGTSGESALQILSGNGDTGQWNDLQASSNSFVLGYVVEYGGMTGDNQTYASASRVLPVTISTNQVVDVNWTELNFDYANKVEKVGNGKAVNDKVLFQNVTTRNGVCVDGVVTTKALDRATISAYDTGTHAGGTASNFEVDVNTTAAGGSAEFQFDFFVCGTYGSNGSGATRVVLKNTGVTAIDIDYNQWNELTNFDSYTLASDTKLHECAVGTACGTTGVPPTTYPASRRFQGPSSVDATLVQDQVVANYGSIDTFTIKMGNTTSNNPNYFGVAFKGLPWGTATPSTQGGSTTYSIAYNGNGSTGGTVPASQTGVTGKNFAVTGNTGTLVRTGYTFAGWNTSQNGTGTSYSAGSTILMPNGGTTLYAMWTPAGVTLTYNANGGTGAPTAEVRNAGSIANLSAVTPTRTGYTFVRWNTETTPVIGTNPGTNYNAGASFTMPSTATTLYAQWQAASGGLVYNLNGGSVSPAITNPTGNQGSTVLVTAAVPTLAGFTFAGWNTSSNGSGTSYLAGSTYTFTAGSVNVYAQWVPNTLYTLNYNSNGATGGPGATSAYSGQSITLSTNYPARTGYTCNGWSSSPTGTPLVTSPYTMPGANTTLYAVCSANNYHVTYNSNYGTPTTVADATNYNYLSTVTTYSVVASGFSQATYDLVGWATSPTGGVSYAPGTTFKMQDSDVTLYAVWVHSNVEIRYDANGGTGAPAAASAAATSTYVIDPTEPTRTGFTFTGWAAAGNNPATGPFRTGSNGSFQVPAGTVTLVAQWTPITHTVTYNTNGGSTAPTDPNAYGYQQTATVSGTIPTKSGYVFLGWNTASNGTGTSYTATNTVVMLTSNVTLYAQWTADSYRLTYNANGGTGAPSFENRVFGTQNALSSTLPTRSGYTFTGWNTVADGTGTNYAAADAFTMPAANVTLYAQWSLTSSGVTYNAHGGSGAPAGANFNFGASVTVSSTVPTYTGYTFTGWNTRCDGTGTPYSATNVFTMGASSIELCALWTPVSYQLIYDGNGGTGVPNASAQAYNSTVTTTAGLPNRPGYTFISWNTSADGTGTPRATSSTFTMPASNVTLYAIWSLNAYTVYYNMNSGSGSVAPQPARFGTSVNISSAAPTRTGFTFAGWNTQANGSGTSYTGGSSLTMPASNVTLYAQWTAIDYSVNYSANGGSGAPSAQTPLHAGDAVTLSSTAPTRTGYQFNGWNTRADGTGINYLASGSLVMPSSNVNLYAVWVPEILDLLYNANGGSGAPSAETAATGSTVTVTSTTPVRAGYNFTGWNTQAGGGGTAQANGSNFQMPGTALTLYAQWTPKNITLHYDLNGGSANANMPAPADVTQAYNTVTQLAASNTFGKTNANFIGWNTAADGSGTAYAAESNFTMPDADVTLYAQWLGVYYVVEYNPNGGTGQPAAQLAAAGETVAVAAQAPVLSGYEFTGWTEVTQGTSYAPGAGLTMPATNVTMLANYRVRVAPPAAPSTPVVTPVEPTPPVVPTPTPVEPTPPPVVDVQPLTVKEVVYFKGDRSFLLPETITALKKLIAIAKTRGVAATITIIGRVKETADKSYDLKLSKARATHVADYLKKMGLQGPYKIVAAGISPENKWISRRVEITVTWTKK